MSNSPDWCNLSLREKVILFLGVLNKPVERKKLEISIWLLDKLFMCEAQEKQARDTRSVDKGRPSRQHI